MQSRKRRNQVENFLHFEDSPELFPVEYCLQFGGVFQKYSKMIKNDTLGHYRTRSTVLDGKNDETDENQSHLNNAEMVVQQDTLLHTHQNQNATD